MDLAELRDLPLVYVDDLARPVLTDADLRHFGRVLRLRAGDPLVLGDGRGGWRPARYGPEPELTGEGGWSPPADPIVTVAFSAVKGERPEWFAQKLTELGVDRIAPVTSARTVVRWDDERAATVRQRMCVVAREACLQSRRLHLPTIEPVTSLEQFLRNDPGAALADPAGDPIRPGQHTLVVGPEGGFTPEELAGVGTVSLPGNVLRATTAAVVAGAVVCGLRSGQLRSTAS